MRHISQQPGLHPRGCPLREPLLMTLPASLPHPPLVQDHVFFPKMNAFYSCLNTTPRCASHHLDSQPPLPVCRLCPRQPSCCNEIYARIQKVPLAFPEEFCRSVCPCAVCDIPLDHICSHNSSRDQCKGLGCCFHRGVCIEKSVSTYAHVFCAFILIIAGAFIFTTVYRVVQERKEKEAAMELPLSFKPGDKVVAAPIARRLAVLKARTARALPCAGCAGNTDKSKSWDCPAFRVQGSAFFPPHILPVKDTQSAATLAL
ncbi:hypothetical protein QTO34_016686 [Cnephaeus nilssonii]|uniref:Uncharacterized protein n=1 Tax=Cnephaeus nilssonii TaxID=3371016 RepID=A0AA40I2S3_CNENI|nr:hypothetical protein QTO34_016686 [Eptesicus nilssonii]